MFGQLVRELQPENALGLLLAAQLGSTPSELTLVIRTTLIDTASGGLRPIGYYTIQMSGLIDHKMTLGPFNHAAVLDDHPLLYEHNLPSVRVFVSSPAADAESIMDEIEEAHQQMFGVLRLLETDLNKRSDPQNILTQGIGLIGEMPKPFAEKVSKLLTEHDIQHNLIEGEPKIGHFNLIAFDNSYFITRALNVESVTPDDED